MKVRLQKILAAAGLCSRREAENRIRSGLVLVNGIPARIGDLADPDLDRIVVDGQPINGRDPLVYYILNKPPGYVTTLRDEKGRPSVADLIRDLPVRVWPVGRLDQESEGLLLLTNDGALTHRLVHPSFRIEKEYQVWVRGNLEQGLPVLCAPMKLDDQLLAPVQVRVLSRGAESCLDFVLHQGKNRQIRRMCARAELQVMRLQRIREGNLFLGSLEKGNCRELTESELEELFREVSLTPSDSMPEGRDSRTGETDGE